MGTEQDPVAPVVEAMSAQMPEMKPPTTTGEASEPVPEVRLPVKDPQTWEEAEENLRAMEQLLLRSKPDEFGSYSFGMNPFEDSRIEPEGNEELHQDVDN